MITLQVVKVLIVSIISFLFAFIFAPFVYKTLVNIKAGKRIRSKEEAPIMSALHEKKAGVPTMAGVLIWGTVTIIAIFLSIMNALFDGFWGYMNFISRPETYLPLAAMIIAGLLGLLDDFIGVFKIKNSSGLKIKHKLIAYLFLGVIGASWFYFKLGWDTLMIPFIGNIAVGWLYIPIFIFVIIASTFSANETDGLDGLLGGTSLFSYIALTIVAFVLEKYNLAAFGGAMIGSLLAFLWFNIHPAKFIMGDTGSMPIGMTLGVIAMLTNTTLILPFFAFIFVLESASVIIQVASKKFRGKKVFLSAPIHHHFEALGWGEARVTMRFWIISAMTSTIGLIIFFLNRYL
ncbi:MAG: phospho-N-acetylmuramoyl-pentapeptide-transferase [Candidatus Pacebacteria bacterium]|nr:phospho-N-acetylmuramoyl-pentapeptide-transferase [Candidatus Paceibacterota bacterium]